MMGVMNSLMRNGYAKELDSPSIGWARSCVWPSWGVKAELDGLGMKSGGAVRVTERFRTLPWN